MSQVALVGTPAAPVTDARGVAADAGATGADAGGFSDIFKGLGEKRGAGGRGAESDAGGHRPAAKDRGPGLSAGSGLHRLLASGRLAPAANADADPAAANGDGGDAPVDEAGRKGMGKEPATSDDGGAGGDPVTLPLPTAAAMVTVPAEAPVAERLPAKVAKPRDDGSEAKPERRPARGVVVVAPEGEDGTPAAPVRVPVTVESIETHFAPIAMTSAAVAEAAVGAMRPAAAGPQPVSGKGAVKPADGAVRKAEGATADSAEGAIVTGEDLPALVSEADPVTPKGAASGDEARSPDMAPADGAPVRQSAPAARSETAPTQMPSATLPGATLRQVGDTIAASAADMASEAAAAPAGDAGGSPRAVVKVLNIRLDPPEYGQVSVRLTLQGGALSVQMRAERETTAAALDHDREKLAEHLKASGYGTDVTMIDTRRDMAVMRGDNSANAGGGGAGGSQGGSGAAWGGQANGGQPGQGQTTRRDGNGGGGFARDRQEGRDGAASPDTGAGGLYV